MHIVKEHEVAKGVFAHSDRKLQDQFRDWLLHSHKNFDKEISFEGVKWEGKVAVINSFSKGNEIIKIGDHVTTKVKSIPLGTISKVNFQLRIFEIQYSI